MNLTELIEKLVDLSNNVDNAEEVEVKIAMQPNYPLQADADSQIVLFDQTAMELDEMEYEEIKSHQPVVYIAEGANHGYLAEGVSGLLGWR